MKLFGPLVHASAFAALAMAGGSVATPAIAGPAEVALLETYVGSWSGRGQLTGARTETVVCRMAIKKGNQGKVNYQGRCAMAGNTLSVNGTLAYVDAARRFEAAMTTNVGYTGVAIGRRSGDNVVFNLREVGADEEGRAVTVNAAITLNAAHIGVDFKVTFNESGETMAATIPFAK